MAVTNETLRQARRLRAQVDGTVDATVRDLVAAWARAWDEIAGA